MNTVALRRYWPFLAVAALWLYIGPAEDQTSVAATGAANSQLTIAGGQTGLGAGAGTVNVQSTPDTSLTSGSAGATAGTTSGGTTATGAGGTSGAGGGGTQGPAAATSSGGQPQDALGRPLDGDRSKCADGGLLQEDITLQSPPCMPAFVGDNGGATYRGVTADTIRVVIFYVSYDAGVQQVLAANELAMTRQEADELHDIYERFLNGHYEFYGRDVELIFHQSGAVSPVELRAEAKAVVAQHDPFAVIYYAQGLMPLEMADQWSRDGVLSIGVEPVADEFYIERAPFVYSQVPQGYRYADLAADYYCKKMYGKNATLAGDPAMRVKKRKLGVGAIEDPVQLAVAQRFFDQVTGGMCGSSNDGTKLYTQSADPDTEASQRPALIQRLKADGITTTYNMNTLCAEADQQGYFPERFRAEVFDDDFVGRFYAATCGPTQSANVFGIGFFPQNKAREQKEFHLAAKSVDANYAPPYLAEGPFQGLMVMARLFQYAGPNLTPANVYQGSRSMPQIGGWENPDPWPGWTCCNPYTPTYQIGITQDSFTAKIDARQIYWDSSERSAGDGATGAWIGVDGGRRYRVGEWPTGEPKQP